MDNKDEKLNLLLIKLENLSIRQQDFGTEINILREEIRQLQGGLAPAIPQSEYQPKPVEEIKTIPIISAPITTPPPFQAKPQPQYKQPSFTDKFKRENIGKSDFEKFIGENLISKIGILILVIGVAIGAKLAIDKGLISPLTRIILGYLVGVGLMGFAIKLKAKYESFSAVLLSGSIAIMYFITYAAYGYYQLIPQTMAFVLMVIFTSFTVVAAIKYNQQVIAHIGMVGAYAVPFLLSDGSGKVIILFSYIAIINLGILVLAFKKHWKPLFYLSFGITWLIFLAWRIPLSDGLSYAKVTLLFSGIFFITFYITNLAYKVVRKEQFTITDVIILLLNSFIFYGIGYYALNESPNGSELLGLFTLGNAIIHFVVSLIIYKRKLADKNLFYFILAMVITFVTMAVPVQLSGNWVTIFWVVEASILFYLGRMKNIAIYEKEIANYFTNLYQYTKVDLKVNSKEDYDFAYNYNYPLFKTTCVYIYTLLFASILTYLNISKIKSKELAVTNAILNVLTILAFLTQGLYVLSELREAYILQDNKYFVSGTMNIGIRYVSLIFFALLITSCYQLSKSEIFKVKFKTAFDYLLYIAILWVLSSELLHILELNGLSTGYKLGLSILWGVYALFLIGMGLWKNKKYLRIGAIALFAITLIKLFFYDISSLDTISKTIVFVSLGILLLIISFLYNKYKLKINDDVKAEN
ncbi:MAG: DUF2339 domain-containing protein [Pedobacter sp.]|nr:MAG: DUF2339 domain-containing protein [Pedobacter sp.]